MPSVRASSEFLKNHPDTELQNLCIELRASITGASDPWPPEKMRLACDYIYERLMEWYKPEDEMDRCVKRMCELAFDMGQETLKRVNGQSKPNENPLRPIQERIEEMKEVIQVLETARKEAEANLMRLMPMGAQLAYYALIQLNEYHAACKEEVQRRFQSGEKLQ